MGVGLACREMKDFPKIEVVEVVVGDWPKPSEHGQSQQVRSEEGRTQGSEVETAGKPVPLAEQELVGKAAAAIFLRNTQLNMSTLR